MRESTVPARRLGRRTLLLAAMAAPALAACAPRPSPPPGTNPPPPPSPAATEASQSFARLEGGFGGRLGVYALDTGTGAELRYRAGERFPVCSTGKLLTVAAILRLDSGQPGLLDRRVIYRRTDLVANSPVTERGVEHGMTVRELCAAALRFSDNTAANQLLNVLGGPAQVTAFARTIGDQTTELVRPEPQLNDVPPGTVADTSTPEQMGTDLRTLLFSDALLPTAKAALTDWLVANTTGGPRLRAGLPLGWRVGDKTGSGDRGEINDLAVAWPPGRAPLVISVYTVPTDPKAPPNNGIHPAASAIVVKAFAA